MREMKDSGIEWIGLAPISWDYIAIKYLVKSRLGGSWGNDVVADNDEYNRVCMRIADFDFIKLKFKENGNYTIRRYSKQDIEAKTLCYGDLLIEKSGGGEKTPVGRVVVYRLSDENLYANFMERIRLNEKLCTFEFAKYFFYSLYSQGFTRFYYNQTTGIQNLNIERYFREIKVPLLPLNIQQQIADYLDTQCSEIDATAEDIQKEISLLEDYKKSVITEAVTKGLNPDVEMKDSGIAWIGEIPKGWKIIRLKYITNSIGDGLHGTPNYDDLGTIFFINGNNLGNRKISITEKTNRLTEKEYKKCGVLKLDKRTLLMSLNGTYGTLSMYDNEPIMLSKSVGYINVCNKETKEYLYYFLQSPLAQSQMKISLAGTTIANLSLATVRNLKICLPSICEQQQIADFLDSKCSEIDAIIADKKRQRGILAEYKKSLIYEYVTGKKEVPINE